MKTNHQRGETNKNINRSFKTTRFMKARNESCRDFKKHMNRQMRAKTKEKMFREDYENLPQIKKELDWYII